MVVSIGRVVGGALIGMVSLIALNHGSFDAAFGGTGSAFHCVLPGGLGLASWYAFILAIASSTVSLIVGNGSEGFVA